MHFITAPTRSSYQHLQMIFYQQLYKILTKVFMQRPLRGACKILQQASRMRASHTSFHTSARKTWRLQGLPGRTSQRIPRGSFHKDMYKFVVEIFMQRPQ